MYEKDAPHISEEVWTFIEEKQIPSLVFATVSKKSLITMEAVLLLVLIVSMVMLKWEW